MKNLRHLGGATLLTFILSVSAFAGDILMPGVRGEMSGPGVTGDILTPGIAFMLNILRSALS